MSWQSFLDGLLNILKVVGLGLLKLLGIFLLGILLIKIVMFLSKKILSKFNIDSTAQKFLLTTEKFVLYLLLFLAEAQVINIPMTGFVALLSAGSLAVSLALQGSLSNLANGIVLISTKPFKEGDFVKIDELEGTVKEIKMQYTILSSIDNKQISIPNKNVVESEVINYNKLGTRKVIINFELSEFSDVDKSKNILKEVIKNCNYIVLDPQPFIAFDNLSNGKIIIYTASWCKAENYWDAYYFIMDNGYNELKRNNIKLPRNIVDIVLKDEPKDIVRKESLKKRSEKAENSFKVEEDEDNSLLKIITEKKKGKKKTS